jgi:hypothetical protein
MMRIKSFIIASVLACSFFFGVTHHAHAAVLQIVPVMRQAGVGQEIAVDVIVKTEGDESINAAQATLTYPKDILSVLSIKKEGSVFQFWLEDPADTQEDGTIRFIGGTPKGLAGASLKVFQVVFKARGTGVATIGATETVVTANDGKGTNVLSTIQAGAIAVGTDVVAPSPAPILGEGEIQAVSREAVVGTGKPAKPVLRVPLYPDEDRWYNFTGDTVVLWDLPSDILQTAVRVTKTPAPGSLERQKQLFTGKNIGRLEEGTSYVSVQFRNSVGWSDITTRKIAIDTESPVPFEVTLDAEVSDNPSPVLSYETNDALSGIKEYIILVDGTRVGETTDRSFTLPPQKPGKHTVIVRAVDNAGNAIEDDAPFEVIPLPSPTITFTTPSARQDEPIFAWGSSIPGSMVVVQILDARGRELTSKEVTVSENGIWNASVENALPVGTHQLIVHAKDARGAVSTDTKPYPLKVSPKSVISIGIIDLGWFEIVFGIGFLLFLGIAFSFYRSREAKERRGAYRTIASRDVEKLTNLIAADTADLERILATMHLKEGDKTQTIGMLINKLKTQVKNMHVYVTKEIEKGE